jgi:hypothetical protein
MSADKNEPRDPHVLAVARVLDRTGRRVTTLEDNVRRMATDLARLTGVVADRPAVPTSTRPDPAVATSRAASWLLAAGTDAEHLPAVLADLIVWLDLVYLRFPDALLTGCWMWHPWVVEELLWLRGAHTDAYDPETGSWLRVGDWHDRQRPGVERRVNGLLGTCALSRHADRNGRPADVTEPGAPPLAEHHAAIAAHWVATRTAGPEPTDAVLAEAEQAEYAQHQGRR